MSATRDATGYARLSAWQARTVMAVIGLVTGLFVGIASSGLSKSQVNKWAPTNDIELYRAEVDRVRAGEGYYEAAAAELVARGYPTRSVFNWRMPLPMWLIGKLPAPVWGQVLLGLLAAGVILLSFTALANEERGSTVRAMGCAVLLTGPLLPCFLGGDLFVVPVLWAGVLIALSLASYGLGRSGWGVAFGLAALAVRELALPYCALMAAMAWWHGRRRRELAVWLVGLAAWAALFAWHCRQVAALAPPDGLAHHEGWIQFGGAAFVLSVAQMNAYLLLLPQWVTALYFAAAVLGLAGWNTPMGQRVTLAASLYLVAFAVVGQDFNQYWGALIAPLFCFGAARFPASIADLWRAAATGCGKDGEAALISADYR